MRIAILSDSLGIPRPWLETPEKTEFEDVYGYALRQYFGPECEIDLFTMGGIDTADAVHWINTLVSIRRPDVVIFQLGINDCSPRVFRKGSRSIVLRPWFAKLTRNVVLRIINRLRYQITTIYKKVYVDKDKFRENIGSMLGDIQKYNSAARCYWVSICEAPEWLSCRSARLNENIREYNNILKTIFEDRLININDIGSADEIHISDGVHLTKNAHSKLAACIFRAITKDLPRAG